MQAILEGLLIGVGAGVTSSVILGVFHWIRRRWTRRDQVNYLKRRIVESFCNIQSDQEFSDPTGELPALPNEALRQATLEGLIRDLTSAAAYRSSALSENQIFDLQKALAGVDSFVGLLMHGVATLRQNQGLPPATAPGTGLPADINFYRQLYGMFAKIEWLGLPADMPTEKPKWM